MMFSALLIAIFFALLFTYHLDETQRKSEEEKLRKRVDALGLDKYRPVRKLHDSTDSFLAGDKKFLEEVNLCFVYENRFHKKPMPKLCKECGGYRVAILTKKYPYTPEIAYCGDCGASPLLEDFLPYAETVLEEYYRQDKGIQNENRH